jgi:hypothetical protein
MTSPKLLLKALSTRPDASRTLALLKELARSTLNARDLLALHEALLFYKAYPRSRAIRDFCSAQLANFYTRVRSLSEDERDELAQTGVVGSRSFYAYDEPMARWLVAHQQGQIDFDWDEYENKEAEPLSSHLPLYLSEVEQDAVDDADLSVREIIENTRGSLSSLEWLLDRFAAVYPDSIRAEIYNPLQLPLKLELIPEGPSRTLVDDGEPTTLHLWDPDKARAKFDLLKEIKRPLKLPRPLPLNSARKYLDMAHAVLLIRHRELYPLTHANPREVYDFKLERGVRILWWMMKPELRLPLELGWGCIILKNNVPIGYGAGGLLPARAEISINVFDTFRGGEALWLYAQYARICLALCPTDWLATRKWQLGGEGNEEGLLSGSYWFYDKMGFRSVDKNIRKIVDQERRKIAATRGYRTPKRILRKIAEADIMLSLSGAAVAEYREYPLSKIGLLATRVIAGQFGGQRQHLEARVLKETQKRYGFSASHLTAVEKTRFAQMALLILALPDFAAWPKAEQHKVFELCRLKGSSAEAAYGRATAKCPRFFAELLRQSAK